LSKQQQIAEEARRRLADPEPLITPAACSSVPRPCECGCGRDVLSPDETGRPVSFIRGHQPQRARPKKVDPPVEGPDPGGLSKREARFLHRYLRLRLQDVDSVSEKELVRAVLVYSRERFHRCLRQTLMRGWRQGTFKCVVDEEGEDFKWSTP